MSQYNESPKAFIAEETIARYSAVKLTTGKATYVSVAGSGEASIGFADEAASSGENVAVRLKTTGMTFKAVAGEAFVEGATLYNGASGRVVDTSSGTARYLALEAADAAGDVVEVLPILAY
jgi:hypothetical protein